MDNTYEFWSEDIEGNYTYRNYVKNKMFLKDGYERGLRFADSV
jgi:hypothetical protein